MLLDLLVNFKSTTRRPGVTVIKNKARTWDRAQWSDTYLSHTGPCVQLPILKENKTRRSSKYSPSHFSTKDQETEVVCCPWVFDMWILQGSLDFLSVRVISEPLKALHGVRSLKYSQGEESFLKKQTTKHLLIIAIRSARVGLSKQLPWVMEVWSGALPNSCCYCSVIELWLVHTPPAASGAFLCKWSQTTAWPCASSYSSLNYF